MAFERASGILLHPTSLPGPYGIGEIGPQAYAWVDWLAEAGCGLWQILPLGPTSYGDSPYQCFSAFAGNPYLVSCAALLDQGLLSETDLEDMPVFSPDRVDFGAIYHWKLKVLDRAYRNFVGIAGEIEIRAFREFREQQGAWLDEFALFMALKDLHAGRPWWEWSAEYRMRERDALVQAREAQQETIERHAFQQYLFFRQWLALKEHANRKGLQIIGDIPIFVAYDSSDVWANPELFALEPDGSLQVQAGVPPDYFSETGQLWGNPLYRWDVHSRSGYRWWVDRMRSVLSLVDIVRLDHFRGFYDYWEIPGNAKTAIDGRWVPGPGEEFFVRIRQALGELPIIAEDLGYLHPGVYDLRDQLGLPGMKILVFAFGDEHANLFLPHNYIPHSVVYTGTHDNDTTLGWYRRVGKGERNFARRYLARDGKDISWDLIRAAWSSVSVFAVAPLQDVLSLGNEARMNLPGTLGTHNWTWRVRAEAFSEEVQARLQEINLLYQRLNRKN